MNKKADKEPPTYQAPASPEAEMSVLGALLLRPEGIDEVANILGPWDFYKVVHRQIYAAILDLHSALVPVDLVSVSEYLRDRGLLEGVGGPVFLAELSEKTGFATNVTYYAGIVKKKALLRQLLDTTQEIAGRCLSQVDDVDAFLDESADKIFEIGEERESALIHPLADLAPAEAARIEALHDRKREVLGIPSGFVDIDFLTSGWQRGDLIILAARPSMGKTALAVNMSHHAATAGETPVGFISLEQPRSQIVQRLMASTGRIDGSRLRSARMTGDEWSRFYAVNLNEPIYIIDKPSMNIIEVRAQARRLKSRHKIGLLVIDYLQLVTDPRARSREQEIGGISRALKALAKELDIPVIVLSQLNRNVEQRRDRHPMLSDLRESGSIEQDADLVMMIYRDRVYNPDSQEGNLTEVNLCKHRNGPVGMINLAYLQEYMLFQNMAK